MCVRRWSCIGRHRSTIAAAVRTQFHNVIDLMPTVLEVCGVAPPSEVDGVAQMSLHGTSMRYAFASPTARSTRSTQYFEMYGHRAIYHDGWKAVTWHATGTDFDDDQWELYDIGSDFSESNDLASSRPEKLAELIERWWTEAGRYDVLPLDDRLIHTLSRPASRACPPDVSATSIARRSRTCRSKHARLTARGRSRSRPTWSSPTVTRACSSIEARATVATRCS